MADNLTVEEAAAYWDEMTHQIMALSPDIRFAVAQTDEELQAVYRARYEEIIRRGWAKPEDMPEGIERDIYDDHATQLIAWHEDRMMIAGRLIFPSSDIPLPTEDVFNLKIEPYKQVVDAGRAIRLQPDHRDASHTLFFGLMCFAWQTMRARGYTHVCGMMTEQINSMYVTMGVYWEILGEARVHVGAPRLPCKFDLLRTTRTFMGRG